MRDLGLGGGEGFGVPPAPVGAPLHPLQALAWVSPGPRSPPQAWATAASQAANVAALLEKTAVSGKKKKGYKNRKGKQAQSQLCLWANRLH